MKDWTGNAQSVFKAIGSSHHSTTDREENDYYATDPIAIDLLLQQEDISYYIWEPACGEGHMSSRLEMFGKNVKSTDLIDRGYGYVMDFFTFTGEFLGDIITNPPYKCAKDFILHALSIVPDGRKICMFLKVQFMEGKGRKPLFEQHPPKVIYVSSSRINCAKNGNFEGLRTSGGSPIPYAWYVWEKGYQGNTIVKWIN